MKPSWEPESTICVFFVRSHWSHSEALRRIGEDPELPRCGGGLGQNMFFLWHPSTFSQVSEVLFFLVT